MLIDGELGCAEVTLQGFNASVRLADHRFPIGGQPVDVLGLSRRDAYRALADGGRAVIARHMKGLA